MTFYNDSLKERMQAPVPPEAIYDVGQARVARIWNPEGKDTYEERVIPTFPDYAKCPWCGNDARKTQMLPSCRTYWCERCECGWNEKERPQCRSEPLEGAKSGVCATYGTQRPEGFTYARENDSAPSIEERREMAGKGMRYDFARKQYTRA